MDDRVRPKRTVYLVRHGRTALNAQGRFQGGLDEPLDEVGLLQARAIGRKLNQHLSGIGQSKIQLQCSPLKRAVMTMGIVAEVLGRRSDEVELDGRLAEMGFGDWEGLTSAEVKARYPQERRRRKADRWNYRPRDGESYSDLADRVRSWFVNQNGSVFAVAHLGVMRVAAVVAGDCTKEPAMGLVPDPDEIWRFDKTGMTRL